MHRLTFLTVCLLLFVTAKAEHLQGYILVDQNKILFELNYKIGPNNKLTGYSLTAKGSKDETKCRIKGQYHPKTGNLFFYETVVLQSKATYKNLNFCLLTANLNRKEKTKSIQYTGRVTGYVRGKKKICATGTIFVKIKKTTAAVRKPHPIKKQVIQNDTLLSKTKSKQRISYTYSNGPAYIEIWDDATIDGDQVSLFLDQKSILSNYSLTKEKKKIKLNLKGKNYHLLKIKANNEGMRSPNTSTIILTLGKQTRKITAHIGKQEVVYIELRKN